jgi:tetratricopeptide (TPR) repeat protein
LSSFVAFGSVPSVAFGAPPAKLAPAGKKGTKPAKDDKADDPKRADARKAYGEAETKFQSGDYEGAFAAYKQANDAIPAPQTLYKMAICLDKLDKTSEALAAYGAFLSSSPPASMEAKVTEAQGRVTELKKKPVTLVIKVKSDPPGASVTVDGVAQMGTTPLDVKTTSGRHKFRLSSPGYEPYEKEVNLESGGDATVEATMSKSIPVAEAPFPTPAETKPAEKPAEAPPERRSNVAAYVVLGVAGAGAIVGGIFGVKALQGKSDFNNEPTNDKADAVEKDALIADMALGAAITLGVTGTVLLLTNSGSADKAERSTHTALQVAPVVSAQRAGAAVTLRF